MPVFGKFELNVTASSQEELDLIAEAIYSGFAETVIKQHVLWSKFMAPASAPVAEPATQERDRGPELRRVASRTKVETEAAPPTSVKKERATGVLGRGRMGRTQK